MSDKAVSEQGMPWDPVSLEDLKLKMRNFADERDWQQFHTPRNLLLALVSDDLGSILVSIIF